MLYLLVAGVLLLAFVNGANDNFKGVATLWGTARYRYRTVLAWGTAWTCAGGLAAIILGRGLVKLFNGSQFLPAAAHLDGAFWAAVPLGAALTVGLATRLGAPVSTTHALIGAFMGSGVLAVGAGQLNFVALASGALLPLFISPLLALGLTLVAFPFLSRALARRSCVCLTEPTVVPIPQGDVWQAAPGVGVGLRIGHRADCARGDELVRWNTEEIVHWTSAALISFARGVNDTPKIAALIVTSSLVGGAAGHGLVAAAMALGGWMAARRVAETMARRVTPIGEVPGMSANLVASLLVGTASLGGLPVSTTHVALGSIFGLGVRARERTNWAVVWQIAGAWVVTLPLGLISGYAVYLFLRTL